MKKFTRIVLLLLSLCFISGTAAQAQRKEVSTAHAAWEAVSGTFRISRNHAVYTNLHHVGGLFTVARIGVVRHLPHGVSATAGYSFAWLTVPGSDSDALERHEHRPWLQALVPAKLGQHLTLSTRLRYDMRFKQRVKQAVLQPKYDFNHRLRLQESLRLNLPSLKLGEVLPYLFLSEEVMLNFGENISHNTFDQNRLGLMLGLERQSIRLQVGYMNLFAQSASVQTGIPTTTRIQHGCFTPWIYRKKRSSVPLNK